jgi:hypothetical protein
VPAPRAGGDRGRSDTLVLEFAVEGGWSAEANEAGTTLDFHHPTGARFQYGHLYAWDARRTPLPASMDYADGRLALRVDAVGADFPVTIDPLIEHRKLTASDGTASDDFGYSVALSGGTALVGARFADDNEGAAYVFVRNGTAWTEQAKLTGAEAVSAAHFGTSVALNDDTALVGARSDKVGANAAQGAAYVFVRSGTAWTQQARLTAADGLPFDHFGKSVAINGGTAVVGANDTNASTGSAYVFVRTGSTWTQQAELTASDGMVTDGFGLSVAVSGDTALVGAPSDDVDGGGDQGSAYVFVRSGTTWTEQRHLTAGDGAALDRFGENVALSGETAIVGAPQDDGSRGSAYAFIRIGTTWTTQGKLTAADGAANDRFGASVALSGDLAVVGSPFNVASPVNAFSKGSAYVFARKGDFWTEQAKLVRPILQHSTPSVGASRSPAIRRSWARSATTPTATSIKARPTSSPTWHAESCTDPTVPPAISSARAWRSAARRRWSAPRATLGIAAPLTCSSAQPAPGRSSRNSWRAPACRTTSLAPAWR